MYVVDLISGCWNWQGPFCSDGRYGRIPKTRPMMMAHRSAYISKYGDIPRGLIVMHSCDNSICVNPEHLSLGTHSDNMKDAAIKHRLPHLMNQSGVENSNSKYNIDFAEKVREFYSKNKPSFAGLAKHFGRKSKGHAHAIVNRKIWI